jgi:hypothetical protein
MSGDTRITSRHPLHQRRAARVSASVSRVLHGRKVDVVVSAPNLMRLPIHEIALSERQLL